MKPRKNVALAQLNDLLHIDQIEPLSEKDMTCFEDLRAVLEKHGALKRFGVTLLHKHFDLEEGEVLVEHTDEKERLQTIQPERKSDDENKHIIQTAWRLDALGEMPVGCYVTCVASTDYHGKPKHEHRHIKAGN